jgi:hypothetical protein
LDCDGHGEWYLAEARRLASTIDQESTAAERLTAGLFLAEDLANAEHAKNDWDVLRLGKMVQGAAARILWHSPDRYEEACERLESLIPVDDNNWYEATNSLLIFSALSPNRHDQARRQIENLDVSRKVYFPIDPRVFALAATLIMDGKESDTVRKITAQLDATTVKTQYEPVGLTEYLRGEWTEEAFVEANNSTRGHWSHAELFVALIFLGERDREQALAHLEKSIEADFFAGFHWWALGLRNLLKNDDPLVDWLR